MKQCYQAGKIESAPSMDYSLQYNNVLIDKPSLKELAFCTPTNSYLEQTSKLWLSVGYMVSPLPLIAQCTSKNIQSSSVRNIMTRRRVSRLFIFPRIFVGLNHICKYTSHIKWEIHVQTYSYHNHREQPRRIKTYLPSFHLFMLGSEEVLCGSLTLSYALSFVPQVIGKFY